MGNFIEAFNKFEQDYKEARHLGKGAMTLVLVDESVELQEVVFNPRNPMHLTLISRFEMRKGLTSRRWEKVARIIEENIQRKGKT